jgi:hypothetical protein
MATPKVDIGALFGGLQEQLKAELETSRKLIVHASTKGDASELNWREMLRKYLPARYEVSKAFVIDSEGESSEQIDVVIHDRQYSPFLLNHASALYVPAESVYAVLEVKQDLSKAHLEYAAGKIRSVRGLCRTSVPIRHAGGVFPPKPLHHILGGILCLESSWNPPFGKAFVSAMGEIDCQDQPDLGCAIQDGAFELIAEDGKPVLTVKPTKYALVFFFLRLVARLQDIATVPAIDMMAYGRWIADDPVKPVGKETTLPPSEDAL